MSVAKTALAASVILATLGLAGCQTTEEGPYYSSRSTVSSRVYYDDTPRWQPPPRVVVAPPTRVYYDDTPRWQPPPRVIAAPPPRVYYDTTPRWQPQRPPQVYSQPRYQRTYDRHDPSISANPMRRTSGQSPGYDTQ